MQWRAAVGYERQQGTGLLSLTGTAGHLRHSALPWLYSVLRISFLARMRALTRAQAGLGVISHISQTPSGKP